MPDETHETNEAARPEEPRRDEEPSRPAEPVLSPATVRRLGGCVELETR